MNPVWILGAGGHAKVVLDTVRAQGRWTVAGILDDDISRIGSSFEGITIKGPISSESVDRFGIESALMAIGPNSLRASIVERVEARLNWITAIHPHSYVAPSARVGSGTVVFAGAVVQPGTTIGRHAILNTGCGVDHDCEIGDFAHIAPGGRIAGACKIEEGALLGLGCGVIQGRTVGAWAIVGAGAVVISDIPARATAIGVPARLRNPSTDLPPA